MALSGKYISVKTIIAKVFRDLQIKEDSDVAFTDIIEWAAEALDFIHVYPQYVYKQEVIKITNYKGELPCDYIGMDTVNYNGSPLRYSTDSFGPSQTGSNSNYYLTPYSYNQKKIENAVFVDPSTTNYFLGGASIKIQNGYIKTSFMEDNIAISYIAMVVDEDGFPMVPDEQPFKEALYWYITYKYLYPKVLNGDIQGQFYQDAYTKWQWYCNQAGAEAMMPDLITLENLKRSFLSLKPNLYRFYDNTSNYINSSNTNSKPIPTSSSNSILFGYSTTNPDGSVESVTLDYSLDNIPTIGVYTLIFPAQANLNYLIVREASTDVLKNYYENTNENNGSIPDSKWQITSVGGYRYYYSRTPFAFDAESLSIKFEQI